MNDTRFLADPGQPTPGALPALPHPVRSRWQPLRVGLVELFHYDSEEFWFRDGHLLSRGNNGTGKSKVLSLTLPFLFDAQLKSSRIEPDGDASKKMASNLLLGKHDRRLGYAWIEFGRLGEDGGPEYLTLGCGMAAQAARSSVDSWFFMAARQRIGQDLWFISPQRAVLTKDRLSAALGGAGQVFDTAGAYRRAVDECLFQLGEVRYGALMDTLIQLRQPQLSMKPNEHSLSGALTEALPPLPHDLLGDVAEAMSQLEQYSAQLQELGALYQAIDHLQAEVAAAIQRLLQDAERRLTAINAELEKRPTSTGVRFKLVWEALPEGSEGAPVGLDTARKRLRNTSFDAWSEQDRKVVGAMLQNRISSERARADADQGGGGGLLDMPGRALDYRRWHRFRVVRLQDGQWRALSGPASSGERALGLTVPLFAAVSSFYSHGGSPHAPRLILLDEVFAGIDDAARAHCMALVREFDLDFVMTSEREWGCYAELPGVSICQLQRHEGIDAVYVSRWSWDGLARRAEDDGARRFPDAGA